LWLPFVLGAVLVTVAIVIGFLVLSGSSSAPGHVPKVVVPDSGPRQADWKITAVPAGLFHKPTKHESKQAAKRIGPFTRMIKNTFDALYLVPDRFEDVVKGYFTQAAASDLLRTKLAPPAGAEDVQTLQRSAVVALDSHSSVRAAAHVRIRARAKDSGKMLKWLNETTLWLEKDKGNWRVIGFDVDQSPIKKHRAKSTGGGHTKQGTKHGGKG
jgi:hypothetical protein